MEIILFAKSDMLYFQITCITKENAQSLGNKGKEI